MFLLLRQTLSGYFAICLCILGISLLQFPQLQKEINTQQNADTKTLERELAVEKNRLNLLQKVPSFGYDNLVANWTYLNFLQYFGDEESRTKTGYGLSPEYFEIILGRDPRFLKAYLGLLTSTSIYAGMPEKSIKITAQGLKSLSPWVPQKSYYVWRYKGIDELLFLGDSPAAKQSFEMAADWAKNHTDEESKQMAKVSARTAQFLATNPDSRKAQISSWMMVLNNQIDEKVRKRAIKAIENLGAKVIVNSDGTNKIILPSQD